jgi:hypothetical protein
MRTVILLIFILLYVLGVATAQAQSDARICNVSEAIDSGGYTYIRCMEGNTEIWLAMPQIKVNNGENISFYETPSLMNFESKTLGRKFSQLMFVPGIYSVTAPKSTHIEGGTSFSNVDKNNQVRSQGMSLEGAQRIWINFTETHPLFASTKSLQRRFGDCLFDTKYQAKVDSGELSYVEALYIAAEETYGLIGKGEIAAPLPALSIEEPTPPCWKIR